MSSKGTVANYGMLAKEDIAEGEVLFTIPRSVLLHQGTSKVSQRLEQGDTLGLDGWDAHETHTSNDRVVQLISADVLVIVQDAK